MINFNYTLYIFYAVAIAIAMTIHEYSKAVISKRLGDYTPEKQGRITLNPFKHIEPIGFMVMLIFGYGWSKPIETNGFFYKDWKKGTIITYITPSIINLVVGMLASLTLSVFTRSFDISNGMAFYFAVFLHALAQYNIALAIFNMIPVYPMDAYRVLLAFLSPNNRVKAANYESIFMVIMIILLFSGILTPFLNIFTDVFMFQ